MAVCDAELVQAAIRGATEEGGSRQVVAAAVAAAIRVLTGSRCAAGVQRVAQCAEVRDQGEFVANPIHRDVRPRPD